MISITINGEEQSNANISEQWIAEQISNRKQASQAVCVEFIIRCGDINVNLPGGQCPSSGNGKPVSAFNAKTQKIIRRWEDKGFRNKDINPGMVISFWKHARKFCN